VQTGLSEFAEIEACKRTNKSVGFQFCDPGLKFFLEFTNDLKSAIYFLKLYHNALESSSLTLFCCY